MRMRFLTAVAVPSVVLLSACTPAQLRMPDGFVPAAASYEVSGHSPRRFNEPLRFGPFSALEMEEGATFEWALPLTGFEVGATRKPYAYTLVARDLPPVQVQCVSRAWTAASGRDARRATIDLTALSGPLLACGLRLDGQAPQRLEIARQGRHLEGNLQTPWGDAYRVRGLSGYEGTPLTASGPIGYAIVDGSRTLAVVDLLNHGRVHLAAPLDDEQRMYVAATAAALLMLDPELGEG